MNNFNYSSDYHFGPLNAFICYAGWHRGLCYPRDITVIAFVETGLPSPLQGHLLWLRRTNRSGNNSTACIHGLWENAALSAKEEMARAGAEIPGGLGRIWISCYRLWFPPRLLQASCPTWAARAPPARTTWPTVWKSSRRTRGIKTSWRNSHCSVATAPKLKPVRSEGRSCGHCTSITGSTIPWVWVLAPPSVGPIAGLAGSAGGLQGRTFPVWASMQVERLSCLKDKKHIQGRGDS